MSGYIGTQPVPQATQTRDAFTATAGQTSFATSGYTPNFLDVFLNGVKLAAADYTATNGSDVVLASGAVVNDILEVVAYTTFNTALATNAVNLAITGDLDVDGTTNLDVIDVDGAANFAADVTFADGADIITASAGTSNFRAGVNAGNSIASGGNQNVVVGDEAGTAITTGDGNVAVGFEAGNDITTGSYNTIMGWKAGDKISTGGSNTAIGDGAIGADTLGQKSVAIGSNTLNAQNFTSSTDTYNTAMGWNAGASVTTGIQNTLIGGQAGDAIQTGSRNINIGYAVDSGHDAVDTITIGNSISGADNDFSFGKASNVVHNDFDADANWSRSSDERLKKNITNQTLGLDFINDLRTVKYNWKASNELDASDAQLAHLRRQDADGNIINDMNTTVTMHNFIAQEVKAALDTAGVSNFAGWKEDQNGVQQVSREMFVIPLVKAVQELSTALDAALARITTLEGE